LYFYHINVKAKFHFLKSILLDLKIKIINAKQVTRISIVHPTMNYTNKWNKIILVDDDVVTNHVHKKLINHLGFEGEVVSLPDGSQAMNYISSSIEKPQPRKRGEKELVLLDLHMPKTNGWNFLQQFMKFDKRTKNKFRIVMISSSIHPDDIDPITKIPEIQEYIIKPISVDHMKKLIYG
jgi:response regulator of citrate/malate metabolism